MKFNGRYILKGREAVPCPNLMTWARWIEDEKNDRQVARTQIGEAIISTVFLGLNYSFGGKVPMVFETMVFGDMNHHRQFRYSTWDEAVAGHDEVVEQVRKELN